MRVWGLLVSGLLLVACQDRPAAPSAQPAGAAPAEAPRVPTKAGAGSAPAPVSAPAPSGSPPAPSSDAEVETADIAAPAPEDAGRPAPVGGNWIKCYASFQPRTKPELDVMRLALLCGPSNGMHKLTAAPPARIEAAGGKREHRFQALAGDCYRLFAVGSPEIEDLDVEVLDPVGARVAFDTSDDRWPVVKADGAFCVFRDGEYRAVVTAQRGSGSYAIEIWRLR